MSDARSVLRRGRDALLRHGRRLFSLPHANIERFDTSRISGWISPPDWPGNPGAAPVALTLHIDNRPALSITANQQRADVQDAGAGPLRCGFDVTTPRLPDDGRPHRIELKAGKHVLHRANLTHSRSQTTTPAPRPPKKRTWSPPPPNPSWHLPHRPP